MLLHHDDIHLAFKVNAHPPHRQDKYVLRAVAFAAVVFVAIPIDEVMATGWSVGGIRGRVGGGGGGLPGFRCAAFGLRRNCHFERRREIFLRTETIDACKISPCGRNDSRGAARLGMRRLGVGYAHPTPVRLDASPPLHAQSGSRLPADVATLCGSGLRSYTARHLADVASGVKGTLPNGTYLNGFGNQFNGLLPPHTPFGAYRFSSK